MNELIHKKFEESTEKVILPINQVLEGEEFEEIDDIIQNCDVNTKRRILRHYDQLARINDAYVQKWYAQGFNDGVDYAVKKENNCSK